MKKPCKGCIVSSCCSERCRDYAIFVYETKEYENAGKTVSTHIEGMEYEEAIDHILKVEQIVTYIDRLPEPL